MSHLLKEAFEYRNKSISKINNFEEMLNDWICEYDPNCFINFNSWDNIHFDIINVEVKDLNDWYENYHQYFCDELQLKLFNLERIINYDYPHRNRCELKYTFKGNVICKGICLEEIIPLID